MKITFRPRKHYYIARVGIFLIAVALIVATASCGAPAPNYGLTMAVNPIAGGTASILSGYGSYTSGTYAAGTVVNIQAVNATCFGFANWTAPAGTFGNAAAAATTFTMPAQNVTVTANFVDVCGL